MPNLDSPEYQGIKPILVSCDGSLVSRDLWPQCYQHLWERFKVEHKGRADGMFPLPDLKPVQADDLLRHTFINLRDGEFYYGVGGVVGRSLQWPKI